MSRSEEVRDLANARARFAFRDVSGWGKGWKADAAQRVKGLPIAVRSQGIMVAIAMLLREDKAYSRHLADLAARWLLEAAPHGPLRVSASGSASARALLDACLHAPRADYLAAELEAMLLYDQVKLFADALVDGEG